ncbi:MAG TPA: extracellular solute-binding protein [Chloroflexota bacterium]|nr:extracellular solute-binding protein [Chloroflexota bacterium]
MEGTYFSPLSRRRFLTVSAATGLLALVGCSLPTSGAPTATAARNGTAAPPIAQPTPAVSGQKIEISYFHFAAPTSPQGLVIPYAVETFNNRNPEIEVKPLFNPGLAQLQAKLETMIAGGTPPDTAALNPQIITPMYSKGLLLDLSPYIARDKATFQPDDFYPQTLTRVIKDGKQYGVPLQLGLYVILYNKTLFDQAGVAYPTDDWTWEVDFLQAAQKLIKGNGATKQYGTSLPPMELVIWANGGDVITEDGKSCVLDQPSAYESVQWLGDLRFKYGVAPRQADLSGTSEDDLFTAGRLAMDITLSSGVSTIERAKPKFDWDVAHVPKGKIKRATIVQGPSIVVLKDSKHLDSAWKWVEFFTGPEMANYETITAHMTMARQSTSKSYLALPPPPQHRNLLLDSIAFARQLLYLNNWAQINDAITKNLDDVLVANNKSAKDATHAACQQVKSLL